MPILAAAPEATFVERMGQMNFTPSNPDKALVCAERGAGPVQRLVATWPASIDEATAAAALISMGKAWDTAGGPTHHVELCIARPEFTGEVDVGALANGPFIEQFRVFASGSPSPATTADQIDYDALAVKTKTIFKAFEADFSR